MKGRAQLMSSARTGDASKDEWRTPPLLYQRIEESLGLRFDLDVFANDANRFTTEKVSDGLADWALSDGSVPRSAFCNPPYSQMRLAAEFIDGNHRRGVDVVCSLVPARVETFWWQRLTSACACVAFFRGRVRFHMPDGTQGAGAPFPSALVVHARNHTFSLRTLAGDLDAVCWIKAV